MQKKEYDFTLIVESHQALVLTVGYYNINRFFPRDVKKIMAQREGVQAQLCLNRSEEVFKELLVAKKQDKVLASSIDKTRLNYQVGTRQLLLKMHRRELNVAGGSHKI
jgi:hypothetical protein